MRYFLRCFFLIGSCMVAEPACGQGWVAEIDLDFNHDQYAYEKITNAKITFSNVTVSGSSSNSQIHFTLTGNDPRSGTLSVSVSGLAWEPYDAGYPRSEGISASFSGSFSVPCQTGFFEKYGETPQEQIYIWIKIYPRLEISSFLQDCDRIVLTSSTCSPTYAWEVSDNATAGFKTIAGKATSSITITRAELIALGFSNPYGRKYFRVTGVKNTTSQLQAIEVYYPGPFTSVQAENPRCYNGSDGLVKINITSAVNEINDFVVTLFSNGSALVPLKQEALFDGSSITFNGLSAGAYVVRVENNTSIDKYGNCWKDSQFRLQNPEPVSIGSAGLSNFNGFHIRCKGGSDGTINIIPAGGTRVYSAYQWTPAVSNSALASNLVEGTYQVKVKDSNGCWSESYTYNLKAPENIQITLTSTGGKNGYDVSCHDKADGAIFCDISGGVPAYSIAWSDGNTQPARESLAPGTYKVTAIDRNGCSITDQLTLHSPPPISFSIAQVSGITCPGAYSGVLEVQSPVNALGDIAYIWNTGERYQRILNVPAGTYTVAVSDEQGCGAVRSYTLTEPPSYSVDVQPTSNYNGSVMRCNGDNSGALKAIVRDQEGRTTTAQSYTWYKNSEEIASSIALPSLSDLAAGAYRLEITYGAGCRAEDAFVLTEPDPVTVLISNLTSYNGMPISCDGAKDAAIRASASGGTGKTYSYLWSNGTPGSDLVNIGAGSYHVIATDVNGCTGLAEKIVSEPKPLLTHIAVASDYNGQPISCTGAMDARLKGSAEGGTPPVSYAWSSGQNTSSTHGIGAGTYILSTRDINGCTSAASYTLADPVPVAARISGKSNYNGYGVSCNGSRDGYIFAEGIGGTGKYTYTWGLNGPSTPLYENLGAGDYTLTVRDQNGCLNSITSSLHEPRALSVPLPHIQPVSCHAGGDGEIHLSPSGGTSSYVFSKDGTNWQTGPVLSDLTAGSYSLYIKDMNGCGLTVTASVPEPLPLTISFEDITPALCGEPRGSAKSIIAGGVTPYSLQWRNAEGQVSATAPSISEIPSGIYTLEVTDGNLCSASRPVAIPAADGPEAEITDIEPATCSYSHDGSACLLVNDGVGPFSIRWTNGQHTPLATELAMGEYLVAVTDSNNCTTVKTVVVPGPDTLRIELLELAEPTCHGTCDGRLSLSATGGNGNTVLSWESQTGSEFDHLFSGTYTVSAIDDKQCKASATFTLNDPEPLEAELTLQRAPTCPGACNGAIELRSTGGTGAVRFEWSNGEFGNSITGLCAGSYTTKVTDGNQCEQVYTYTLTEAEVQSIDLGGSAVLCAGQDHMLDAGPFWRKYFWTSSTGFKSSNRSIIISEAGNYWLEAVDHNECVVRDTFRLDTTNDLLQANFLLPSEAMTGDTVVLIDISWPVPDHISWDLPAEMQQLNNLGDIIYGRFDEPGKYDVSMTTTLGECRDMLTKYVVVMNEADSVSDEGRVGYNQFITEFSLYPNPNDGMFDVAVGLLEATPVTITVWNALTSRMVARFEEPGATNFTKHIDLRPLSAGPYTLRLDWVKGSRYIRFIVR